MGVMVATHKDTKTAPSEWGKQDIHPLLSLERMWCSRQSSHENSPSAAARARACHWCHRTAETAAVQV